MAKKANASKDQGSSDADVLRQSQIKTENFSSGPLGSFSKADDIRPANRTKDIRKDEKVTVKTKTRFMKKLRSKTGITENISLAYGRTVNHTLVKIWKGPHERFS